jgi:hypothetical protein
MVTLSKCIICSVNTYQKNLLIDRVFNICSIESIGIEEVNPETKTLKEWIYRRIGGLKGNEENGG